MREVAPGNGPSGAVFVDSTITVIVNTFGEKTPSAVLSFAIVSPLHQNRVAVDGDHSPFRMRLAHLSDIAVAIEIFRAIFVGGIIVIIVDGPVIHEV